MIKITDFAACSGCYACVSSCPTHCITMKTDEEGFWYPLVEEDKCISCGVCDKRCPITLPLENKRDKSDVRAFAAYTKNDEIREKSSSGGIFTEIATHIIKNDGVVFGAGFDDSFDVVHISVESIDELYRLRGSKYVQSSIGNAYEKAESYLKDKRLVLFTGTPCQIGGLYKYLNKEYDNLITQDIVCHGTPSPAVWREYIKQIERCFGSEIAQVSFRDKQSGWRSYSVRIKLKDGREYVWRASEDVYMQGFSANLCLRPSCYNCAFKQMSRQSDFTLADFWGIENVLPHMDDDKGVSLVLINSKKAEQIINGVKVNLKDVNMNDAVKYNVSMIKCPSRPLMREEYISDVLQSGFENIEKKYFKKSLWLRTKKKIKLIIKRLRKG